MKDPLAVRARHRAARLAGAVALCLAIPAGLIGVLSLPSSAATTPTAGGVYNLASGASGKCVNIAANLLVQVACSTTTAGQLWTVTASGGNFTLASSGMCATVPDSTSGSQLSSAACGSAATQQWSFTASSAASGKYVVKNASSGLCLSDQDGSTAGNNPIVQETCSDIARMQWSFNYVSGATASPTATSTAKPTVASDGTGSYRTVQAAIDAVPAGNTARKIITIKAGTYREIVTVPSNKPYITLQGLGSSAGQTVIVYNNSAYTSGTSGSASVFINGHDFVATNLTISNDYDENTYESGDQAVALSLSADRALFTNVRLLGDQDTFLVNNSARGYMVNSYVEGTVDFIFGGGIMVFNASTIHEKRTDGGVFTAASTPDANTYGFLFYKCTVNGAGSNITNLGRPWRQGAQVLYRESSLSAAVKVAQPWTDMSTNTWKNARFFEYKNTGAGATTNSNRPQMSDATAANYTPQKYLAGSDGWNPV